MGAVIVEHDAIITYPRKRVREPDLRLGKGSHNSSQPASSGLPSKTPPLRSLRKSSGRKPGEEKRRKAVTRHLVNDPDHHVIIPLMGTCICGRCCGEITADVSLQRHQSVEVRVHHKVTEYRIVRPTSANGNAQRSACPESIRAPVEYGRGFPGGARRSQQYLWSHHFASVFGTTIGQAAPNQCEDAKALVSGHHVAVAHTNWIRGLCARKAGCTQGNRIKFD